MATLRFLALSALAFPALAAPNGNDQNNGQGNGQGNDKCKVTAIKQISLGPRPYWLVNNMDDGPLKTKLASCSEKVMKHSDWSISHRGGGTLQFPEHTTASILAGVITPCTPEN